MTQQIPTQPTPNGAPPQPAQPQPAQPWPQQRQYGPEQYGPQQPYSMQQNTAQQYGPPSAPPPAYPAPSAPAPRRRTGLIVGSIIGAIVIVGGLVVGALFLFGSKTLDTAKLQQEIVQLTQEKAGVSANDVSCPTDRDIKAGDEFTCTAQVDGQPAKFTVRQQDDKGNVHIELANSLLVVSKFQDLLSTQVGNDYGFPVTSKCEAGGHSVLVDGIGKDIRCTVTDREDPTDFMDVMARVDDLGQVTYQQA